MLKAYLIAFFCFLLFLFFHILIFRMKKLEERFKMLVKIFFSIIPVYILLYAFIPYDLVRVLPAEPVLSHLPSWLIEFLSTAVNFTGGLMFYVFLFLGYCQFYFIVDRSISVRIMIELDGSPEKKLSFDEIKKIYEFDEILSRRLTHMLEGNYVVDDGGYYKNTQKGIFEAKLFRAIKEFLRLGKGG